MDRLELPFVLLAVLGFYLSLFKRWLDVNEISTNTEIEFEISWEVKLLRRKDAFTLLFILHKLFSNLGVLIKTSVCPDLRTVVCKLWECGFIRQILYSISKHMIGDFPILNS